MSATLEHQSAESTVAANSETLALRLSHGAFPAFLCAIMLVAATAFATFLLRSDRAEHEDFTVYYSEALEMRHNINPYTTDFAAAPESIRLDVDDIQHGFDPPTFIALIFVPLTHLRLWTGYWIWQTVNALCLLIALYLLIGRGSGLASHIAIELAVFALLYPAIVFHFWFGQSKLPLLLLLVLMMHWMARGRESWAGFALAFTILLRIFPLVITGYLILQHRWRTMVFTAIGLLIGIAVTIAASGFTNSFAFILSVSRFVNDPLTWKQRDLATNFFIWRQFRSIWPHAGTNIELVRRTLMLATNFLIIAATTCATLRLPANKDPDWRLFSLWVATAVLLLPIAWDYDLVLMLIPFAQLAVVAARGQASRRAIVAAIVSYVLLIWWEYFVHSHYEGGFFSMLTAYLSAYWLAIDQPDALDVPILSIPREIWKRLWPIGGPTVESAAAVAGR